MDRQDGSRHTHNLWASPASSVRTFWFLFLRGFQNGTKSRGESITNNNFVPCQSFGDLIISPPRSPDYYDVSEGGEFCLYSHQTNNVWWIAWPCQSLVDIFKIWIKFCFIWFLDGNLVQLKKKSNFRLTLQRNWLSDSVNQCFFFYVIRTNRKGMRGVGDFDIWSKKERKEENFGIIRVGFFPPPKVSWF
jgi:hypothetical protein